MYRVPGWVNSARRLSGSRREIHTIVEHTLKLADKKPPVAVFSLNIHDRKSKVDHKSYDTQCRNEHLVKLANMLRREKVDTRLMVLIAESTIFRPHPTEPDKYNVRGGHISAALVTVPPLEDERTPIKIEFPISKLPGGANKVVSSDREVDGRALVGQNFEVSAHFESDKDYVMYRDSNSTIDSKGGNSAPVLFSILNLDELDFDYEKAYQFAKQLATDHKTYVRLGNACGEYVLQSFGGVIPGHQQGGMSTQKSFSLTLNYLASHTKKPEIVDAFTRALKEIGAYNDPQAMCVLGDTFKNEYQAGQRSTRISESTLTVAPDNARGTAETLDTNQRRLES